MPVAQSRPLQRPLTWCGAHRSGELSFDQLLQSDGQDVRNDVDRDGSVPRVAPQGRTGCLQDARRSRRGGVGSACLPIRLPAFGRGSWRNGRITGHRTDTMVRRGCISLRSTEPWCARDCRPGVASERRPQRAVCLTVGSGTQPRGGRRTFATGAGEDLSRTQAIQQFIQQIWRYCPAGVGRHGLRPRRNAWQTIWRCQPDPLLVTHDPSVVGSIPTRPTGLATKAGREDVRRQPLVQREEEP